MPRLRRWRPPNSVQSPRARGRAGSPVELRMGRSPRRGGSQSSGCKQPLWITNRAILQSRRAAAASWTP
eukprot:15462957-Alexandrium_andersonii.AAC.1